MLSVADWRLGTPAADFGVVAAAVAPATTIDNAMMRMTSFILVTPGEFRLTENNLPVC
jgi:hypothetical protein